MEIYSTILLVNTTFLILLLEVSPSTPGIRRKDDKGKKDDEGPSVRPTDLISEREIPAVSGSLYQNQISKGKEEVLSVEEKLSQHKQFCEKALNRYEKYLDERLENEYKREAGQKVYVRIDEVGKKKILAQISEFEVFVRDMEKKSILWPTYKARVRELWRKQTLLKEKLDPLTPDKKAEISRSYLEGTSFYTKESSSSTPKKKRQTKRKS